MKKVYTTLAATLCAAATFAQSFDTTGLANSWSPRYNSYETWEQGAFDAYRDANDPADFGWGAYDQLTHIIEGDSIYILKTVNGNFKAISIDQLASGTYSVTHSNLDGSARITKTFTRAAYNTKNFFMYSLDLDQVKDIEPATASWDIVFTKYLTFFPGFGGYPVSGVLHNRNVRVSQVEKNPGGTATLSDTLEFPFEDNISTLGYDWKDAFAGVIYDTLTYFVQDQQGNINRLKFTGYRGSATGRFVFEVNGTADSVTLGAGNVNQVYYSTQTGTSVSVNTDNEWDIALFAQSSFSAIPVRINEANGVVLYRYPKADINYWNTIGLTEERSFTLVSVYPNPAQEQLHIAAHTKEGGAYTLQLIDQTGRVVRNQSGNLHTGLSDITLNLEGIQTGIYFVQFAQGTSVATSRIIVQP
jgi:hypothetical protein